MATKIATFARLEIGAARSNIRVLVQQTRERLMRMQRSSQKDDDDERALQDAYKQLTKIEEAL